MTTAKDILARLRDLDIEVTTDDRQRLLWDRVPPAELRAEIETHRTELLHLVAWRRTLTPLEHAMWSIKLFVRDLAKIDDINKVYASRLEELVADLDREVQAMLVEVPT